MSAVTGQSLGRAFEAVVEARHDVDRDGPIGYRYGLATSIYHDLLAKAPRPIVVAHYAGLALGVAWKGNPW